jgi:hypothetical protein
LVDVLDPQEKPPAHPPRFVVVEDGGIGVPEVKKTRGGGSEAKCGSVRHGLCIKLGR